MKYVGIAGCGGVIVEMHARDLRLLKTFSEALSLMCGDLPDLDCGSDGVVREAAAEGLAPIRQAAKATGKKRGPYRVRSRTAPTRSRDKKRAAPVGVPPRSSAVPPPSASPRKCVVCGKPIVGGSPLKKACSAACIAEQSRRTSSARYAALHPASPKRFAGQALPHPHTHTRTPSPSRLAAIRLAAANLRERDPIADAEAAAREDNEQ